MAERLLFIFVIFAWSPVAHAATRASLPVRLTLTHISADKWRADYVLAKPVSRIELDPAGEYRSKAWRILTPGLKLAGPLNREAISGDAPFSRFSVEVSLFLPYTQGNYTPFERMTDGASAIFMGFFTGDAIRGSRKLPLHLNLLLRGLAYENVITPDDRDSARLSYAYFGPMHPISAGVADLIMDSKAPRWLVQLMQETTARISDYYYVAFRRRLSFKPLVMVSVSGSDASGLSMKGGAIGKEVVYRVGGNGLAKGSEQIRRGVTELIAHELAHVWQNSVVRGGIGGEEPWVHEGGAEAIAVAGLLGSGLFSQAEADAYSTQLIEECKTLNGSVDSYRGIYACGFKRFADYQTDIMPLWRSMMKASEASGAVYSSGMIDAILQNRRGARVNRKTRKR